LVKYKNTNEKSKDCSINRDVEGVKPMWSPHYFLAIPLDPLTKRVLNAQTIPLQKEEYFSKWVHPSDYHLTLLFLGKIDKDKLSSFLDNVRKVASEFPSFSLVMDRYGIFGSLDRPRIFLSGVQDHPLLSELREKVYQIGRSADISIETTPFRPHITIARKWAKVTSFQNEFSQPKSLQWKNEIKWQVDEIVLYESMKDTVPKYKPVTQIRLMGE
jgi:2'-5' RNA ligase